MAALDFLLSGKKEVIVAYFNHGTQHGREAEEFVRAYCEERSLKLFVGSCSKQKKQTQSLEEYWREERLSWLNHVSEVECAPVVTCHHLDDAVEWWVFCCFEAISRVNFIVDGFFLLFTEMVRLSLPFESHSFGRFSLQEKIL